MKPKLRIPIALFAYNRPDTFEQAAKSAISLNPTKIYIYCDGPKQDKHQDYDSVRRVRQVIETLDWPCDVYAIYRRTNMGLRSQLKYSLDELFSTCEFALIMEDDIGVTPFAHEYVHYAVDAMRRNSRIAAASLNNFQAAYPTKTPSTANHGGNYLSAFFHCWGWVGSRAGWSVYDDLIEKEIDESFINSYFIQEFGTTFGAKKWVEWLSLLRYNKLDSWAIRFQLSIWKHGMYSIVPKVNLATNFGFDSRATHTPVRPQWADFLVLPSTPPLINNAQPERNALHDLVEIEVVDGGLAEQKCSACGEKSLLVGIRTSRDGRSLGFFECAVCASLTNNSKQNLHLSKQDIDLSQEESALLFFTPFLKLINEFEAGGTDDEIDLTIYIDKYSAFLGRVVAFDNKSSRLAIEDLNAFFQEPQSTERSIDIVYLSKESNWEILDRLCQFSHQFNLKNVLIITEFYSYFNSNLEFISMVGSLYSFSVLRINILKKYGFDPYYSHQGRLTLCSNLSSSGKPAEKIRKIFTKFCNQNEVWQIGRDSVKSLHVGASEQTPPLDEHKWRLRRNLLASKKNTLYVDCVFFQFSSSGIARMWNEIFAHWSETNAKDVVLLLRGGNVKSGNLRTINVPAFDYGLIEQDRIMLDWILAREGAGRFISTYYTFVSKLRTTAIVYDMIPEVLRFDLSAPPWREKSRYLTVADRAICISRTTKRDLIRFYPKFDGHTSLAISGVPKFFTPISIQAKQKVRESLGVRSPFLVGLPCSLDSYKNGLVALTGLAISNLAGRCEVICTVVPPAQSEKLMLPFKLSFHRFESDADFSNFIASCDLVLWPSLYEGMGYPHFEALACRTNVVISDTEVNREFFGSDANYAITNDARGWADAINSSETYNYSKMFLIADTLGDYSAQAKEIIQNA